MPDDMQLFDEMVMAIVHVSNAAALMAVAGNIEAAQQYNKLTEILTADARKVSDRIQKRLKAVEN